MYKTKTRFEMPSNGNGPRNNTKFMTFLSNWGWTLMDCSTFRHLTLYNVIHKYSDKGQPQIMTKVESVKRLKKTKHWGGDCCRVSFSSPVRLSHDTWNCSWPHFSGGLRTTTSILVSFVLRLSWFHFPLAHTLAICKVCLTVDIGTIILVGLQSRSSCLFTLQWVHI